MKNKFDFYEIVIVSSKRKTLTRINGFKGFITGMSQNEETGMWGYAVSICNDEGYVWDIMEDELIKTGKKANPKDYESVDTVKVRVDPKTGEGEIVEDDKE